jgi:hypothetical protein
MSFSAIPAFRTADLIWAMALSAADFASGNFGADLDTPSTAVARSGLTLIEPVPETDIVLCNSSSSRDSWAIAEEHPTRVAKASVKAPTPIHSDALFIVPPLLSDTVRDELFKPS